MYLKKYKYFYTHMQIVGRQVNIWLIVKLQCDSVGKNLKTNTKIQVVIAS
jgi:hypothetical protein